MIRATTEKPRLDTGCHRDLFLGTYQVYDLYVALMDLHRDAGFDAPRENDLIIAVDVTEELRNYRGHAAHWASVGSFRNKNLGSFDGADRYALLECKRRFDMLCSRMVNEFINEILDNDRLLSELAEKQAKDWVVKVPYSDTPLGPLITGEEFKDELIKMAGNVPAALIFDEARMVESLKEELKP